MEEVTDDSAAPKISPRTGNPVRSHETISGGCGARHYVVVTRTLTPVSRITKRNLEAPVKELQAFSPPAGIPRVYMRRPRLQARR